MSMAKRTRRLAKKGTSVVVETLPSGERIFEVDPVKAAGLSGTHEELVVETKAITTPEPVWTCGSCGAKAGRGDDGKVVLLFERKSGPICLDCAQEAATKAAKIGQGSNVSYSPTSGFGSTLLQRRK